MYKNIALLGTACNPITLGHINVAQYVLKHSNNISEIWICPTYNSNQNKQLLDYQHRLNMALIATKSIENIRIFSYEYHKQITGTYNFINTLQNDESYTDYNFHFIIGQDNANEFHKWKNHEELKQMIPFIVVPRFGYDEICKDKWYHQNPHIYLNSNDKIINTASSIIREKIKSGGNCDDMLNKDVLNYIKKNNLYV